MDHAALTWIILILQVVILLVILVPGWRRP
jgi:hypothetical protein